MTTEHAPCTQRSLTWRIQRPLPLFALFLLPFLAACDAGLPSADEIAERVAETYRDPGRLYVVSHTTTEIDTDAEMGAFQIAMTMDSEQWQDGPERVRTEADMSMRFEAPESEEASMAAGMASAMGLDEIEMLVVRNGDDLWSWTGILDTWSHQSVTDSATPGFGADEMADLMGSTARTVVEHYALSYVGQETIAGREAFVVTAAPKAEGEPVLLFDVAHLEEVELAVDAERYYVLRSVVTIRPDWQAAMQAAQAGAPSAFGDDLPDQRITLRSEVREIVYDAEIDPERFVFTPPEGSTELDLAAFSALDALSGMDDESPSGAPADDAGFESAEAELEAVMAEVMATALAEADEELGATLGATASEMAETYTPLTAAHLPPGCVMGEEELEPHGDLDLADTQWRGFSRRLIQCPSGSAWLEQLHAGEAADAAFASPEGAAESELAFGDGPARYVETTDGQRWLVWRQGEATARLAGTLGRDELMLVAVGMR